MKSDAYMRDLLLDIVQTLDAEYMGEWNDEYLYRRMQGFFDGEQLDINPDYLVSEYVKQNSEDGIVYLYYQPSPKGGWGSNITALISLQMPSSEMGHERTPHVHVRKGKYLKGRASDNTVRVKLTDLTVMDNAEKKAKKLFAKEWDYVMTVIKNNQEKLIKQYNCMLKGAMPEKISLNLDFHWEVSVPNFVNEDTIM